MVSLKRQATTYAILDDQGPDLLYVGNWSRYTDERFNNSTFTATSTPGSSVSFTFSGSEAWIYGNVLNDTGGGNMPVMNNFPTANYVVDGKTANPQTPVFDSGDLLYFQTPQLQDGNHTVKITVTEANSTNLYILDFVIIIPSAKYQYGVVAASSAPSSTTTTRSSPVGAIVGGVIGTIAAIILLLIAACYLLRRRSRYQRPHYFNGPGAGDDLAGEALLGHVEPFDTTPVSAAPPPVGISRPVRQPAHPGGHPSQPLNPPAGEADVGLNTAQHVQPDPNEAGPTHVSNTWAQPRTGKAALISQLYGIVSRPVQSQDSGVRFDNGGAQEPGPSQLPTDLPPTYTPD